MDVTRRDFVRGAGVIGAGALLAGVTGARGQAAAGGAASTSANGDLAVALVGCGTQGRILLRKSGTEPVLRVMCEAEDGDMAQRAADSVAAALRDSGMAVEG